MARVLINGAGGRIGRGVTHELMELISNTSVVDTRLSLVALNDPMGLDAVIDSYISRDPVHGVFDWEVYKAKEGDTHIDINGTSRNFFAEKDPTKIPFKDLGIDMVLECSGFFGDSKKTPGENLGKVFLDQGVQNVIETYPAKTADINLIMGVNHQLYNPAQHRIISNASCTTKSLSVPLQVMLDNEMEIADCRMVTVHAATASQKVLESIGQIVTHSTGAAKATGLVIPSLKGAMGGTSARVPTLDGSISYLALMVYAKDLTVDDLNDLFRENVENPKYAQRLGVIEGESISSGDIINRRENALIIPYETQVSKPFPSANGKNLYHVFLASGYDNELGSAVDPVLLAKYVAEKR